MRAGRRRPTAFTLVELLVVIGIIAALISILAPAVNGAWREAQAVQCAANLRQIASGWMTYATENKGISCPGRMPRMPAPATNVYRVGNGSQFRPRWYVTLGAASGVYAFSKPSADPAHDNTLLIDNPALLCPAEPDRVNNRNAPFGYNFQFLGNSRLRSTGGRYINFPVRVARIRPCETVLGADCLGTAAGKPAASRTKYRVDGAGDLNAKGNHAWSLDPPRLTPDSDYCDDGNRAPANRSAPDPRHSRRANVAYCDGHVERQTLEDLGYAVGANGAVAANGVGATGITAHNRLFSGTTRDDAPPSIR
jgi:prepilin-type processing-associated H-X9-DG protein